MLRTQPITGITTTKNHMVNFFLSDLNWNFAELEDARVHTVQFLDLMQYSKEVCTVFKSCVVHPLQLLPYKKLLIYFIRLLVKFNMFSMVLILGGILEKGAYVRRNQFLSV